MDLRHRVGGDRIVLQHRNDIVNDRRGSRVGVVLQRSQEIADEMPGSARRAAASAT